MVVWKIVDKVLFVCTANICRSPMAEMMFNALAEDAELPLRAESAGVSALEGENMAPNVREVLEELGIRAAVHRARQISEKMVEGADLILTMNTQHSAELRKLSRSSDQKIYTLPEYVDGGNGQKEISDPYGHTLATYRASARQILEYIDLLVASLKR